MTTESNYWDDDEREEGTIERVESDEAAKEFGRMGLAAKRATQRKGYYSVTSSNGWTCSVSTEYGIVPAVGDRFVTWGSIGRPIRGMAVNGAVLYYRTPDEQRVEDQKASEKHKADRVGEYEGKRAEWDARVAALPDALRARVEGFRAHGGDAWRWSYEPYEMACCEEAARLNARFKTGDEVQAFSKLEYTEQKAAHPNMDDGHSGNTMSMSIRLAWLLAEKPELLPQEHGAMCPLVGCEDYGCYAARSEAAA